MRDPGNEVGLCLATELWRKHEKRKYARMSSPFAGLSQSMNLSFINRSIFREGLH